MRKILIALSLVLYTTAFCFAQEQQNVQSKLVLPMFGNQPKTEAEQKKDEKFLTSCDKNFVNRQEASQFFMERGWEYYNEGQVDTAMYRFNLAWLLNSNNKDTYWAFGLVSSVRGDDKEAIGLYERALVLDSKNSLLLADIGSSYIMLYNAKPKRKTLKKANSYLNQAITLDPENAYALSRLAVINFHEKKYADAWANLHKSRELNLGIIDYAFITQLVDKMPDPMGFFKSSDESTSANQN